MTEPTTTTAAASPKQETQPKEKPWGRVLLAGGTDWTRLGKKDRSGVGIDQEKRPDLLSPHILRSLANVEITSIHSSSTSCHCIAIASDGTAWMFGRNTSTCMGVVGVEEVSENGPRHLTPAHLKAPPGTKFVHAACGRAHSLLVGSGGELWSVGVNTLGQCGHSSAINEILHWRQVDGPKSGGKKENVVKAACGVTFSIVLTDTGKVYAFGSGEKGQLGNGRTGEHITAGNKSAFDVHSDPVLVKGLQGKNVVDIAAGNQHSIVLDSEGYVYVFGYNGYCRLGLGNQTDALVAKVVPQFAGPSELTRGARIAAGPTNSVVIDRNGMYWMTGKWKNSGEGSSGQPYTTFKFMPDVMGCKMILASSGGVTHFAVCPDEETDDGGVMTVAWGQNAANGELGLGEDSPRSATKPTKVIPLSGVEVIDIAAAQNTTFFLARPSEKLSELPRHPELPNVPDDCVVCKADKGEAEDPLLCEKCDTPYHPSCLNPPLAAVPEGEWFCPSCSANPGAPIGEIPKNAAPPASAPRKPRQKKEEIEYAEDKWDEDNDDDEEDDDDDYVSSGKKRKGGAGRGGAAKRNRR